MTAPARYIGTAGWSLPSRYADRFPCAGTHLERYARRFDAVEINSSFYRPHRRTTYVRWARSVPGSFRFSVKLPRTITHERRLANCGDLLDAFLAEAAGLGGKLGALLIQLPPSFAFAATVADGFFADLKRRTGAGIVVEPRHPTWFTKSVDARLASLEVARVAADPAPASGAGSPGGWRGVVYYRLHGSPRMYYSDYGDATLAAMRRRLDAHRAAGVPAWCIFDNTARHAATGNALALAGGVAAASPTE